MVPATLGPYRIVGRRAQAAKSCWPTTPSWVAGRPAGRRCWRGPPAGGAG